MKVNQAQNQGATPFYIACQKGQLEVVKHVASLDKVNINQTRDNGATPFYIACQKGHLEVVKYLASLNKVKVNQGNKNGATPFYIACEKGQWEVVKHLASHHRIEVNQAKNDGTTAFFMACERGHVAVLKQMLGKQLDIKVTNKKGNGMFDLTFGKGSKLVTLSVANSQILVNKTDKDGWTPLIDACYYGYLNLVKYLCTNEQVKVSQGNKKWRHAFLYGLRKRVT